MAHADPETKKNYFMEPTRIEESKWVMKEATLPIR